VADGVDQYEPGFKQCDEPLDLRLPSIVSRLGISSWKELQKDANWPVVENYFQGLCDGRYRFLNPSPFVPNYKPVTNRLLAKILHGGEGQIARLAERCNARVVLLLRHPIPVSLSREVYPRLDAFLESDYSNYFSPDELDYGRHILRSGSDLEKGVLDWSLQNAVPLRSVQEDWLVISYEELVLRPGPVIGRLADSLALRDQHRLEVNLAKPSATVRKSDAATIAMFDDGRAERDPWWLVTRWREKVDEDEERRLMEIPARFGIDCYRFGEALPLPPVWMGEELPALARGEAPD
jgi:hypothetical protein